MSTSTPRIVLVAKYEAKSIPAKDTDINGDDDVR
jgi:hypothetical protein